MKRTIFTIITALCCCMTPAQTTNNIQISNVTPPSPHARSLLKVEQFPVSYYTGVPDITIPIYEIKLKDISLPITLSYNASGIKVNEEAGRVGLGWTLNAGGIVTHTVMGRYNDFCAWAYFNMPPDNELQDITNISRLSNYLIQGSKVPLPFSLPQGLTHENLYKALTSDSYTTCGGVELAPDIYHYSIPGYSGKFIFSHSGKIIKEREDNVQLIPVTQKNSSGLKELISWELIAPEGTKYYFNQTEETVFTDRPRDESYYSAFYLTQIESAEGSVINLNYKKENRYLGSFNYIQENEPILVTDQAYYEVAYLDNITYPGGSVTFEYKTDRKDYAPEVRLTAVNINDANGNRLSRWDLVQDYFTANSFLGSDVPTLNELNVRLSKSYYYNSSWNNSLYTDDWNRKRLKLTGITHTGTNISSPEVYSFAYNETNLPTKLSASKDHWGYYNGAPNKSLKPGFYQNTNQLSGPEKIERQGGNANREANPQYTQAFILQQITYPTGGKALFTFESNRYKTNDFENDACKRDFMYSDQSLKLSANQQQGGNNIPFMTQSFNISSSGKPVPLSSKIVLDHNLYKGLPELEISIKRNLNDANPLWSYKYNSSVLPPYTEVTSDLELKKEWNDITLPAGTYILYVGGTLMQQLKSIDVEASLISYPDEYLNANPVSTGGGLRVKEIDYLDINGEKQHNRKYHYTNSISFADIFTSGRLMAYPRYRKDYNTIGSEGLQDEGYSVGYSMVFVEDFDKDGNRKGLQEYHYMNTPDLHLCYTWWDDSLPYGTGIKAKDENPQGTGAYRYSENGTLTKEVSYVYKNGYRKQREIIYTYSGIGGGPHIIWGIAKAPVFAQARKTSSVCFEEGVIKNLESIYGNYAWSSFMSKIPVGYLYPAIRPMQYMLTKKTETLYEDNGSSTTTTHYDHDPVHFYPIREEIMEGDSLLKSVDYIYPFDKTSNVVMARLAEANRINEPVEMKSTAGGCVQHTCREYALFNNVPRLKAIQTNTQENQEMETRSVCYNYDSYGNPLFVCRDNTENRVYLWGYQGQYPVAEIKNATYEEVKNALGCTPESLSAAKVPDMNLINGLRSKLRQAQVQTYTYQPHVGMLTQTLPTGHTIYYVYDGFARLKECYVMEGNEKKVMETYEYHYANQ